MCGSKLKALLPLAAPSPFKGSLSPLLLRNVSTEEVDIVSRIPVVDAHVHIFPQKLMNAVWKFFGNHYWPVRYMQEYQEQGVRYLLERGVRHCVLLQYAHKDGISRDLNRFMAETTKSLNEKYGRRVVTGLATCMPGEPGAAEILKEAFEVHKLAGVKMHSHVQACAANDEKMDEVYEVCARFNKPVLLHSGREPSSAAYKKDTHLICSVQFIADVLTRHPTLRLVIPHMGWDETRDYIALLERFPNLYLDTTMMFSGYFPDDPEAITKEEMTVYLKKFSTRILYGSDWPNIPYEWWTELNSLSDESSYNVGDTALERILWKNAAYVYDIPEDEILRGDTKSSL